MGFFAGTDEQESHKVKMRTLRLRVFATAASDVAVSSGVAAAYDSFLLIAWLRGWAVGLESKTANKGILCGTR